MMQGDEAAAVSFGYGLEGIAAFVVLAEVHRHKGSGFYRIYKLRCSAHVVAPHAPIYREEGHIHLGCLTLQVAQLGQIVAFSFAYLFGSRFFAPVPVVQIAGVEQTHTLQVDEERDAYIGRSEGLDLQLPIVVAVAFMQVGGCFAGRTAVAQDVGREEVMDLRMLFAPTQHLGIEVVGVEVRAQYVD